MNGPPARRSRDHHCRGCNKTSPQRFVFSENGRHAPIEMWRCQPCGMMLTTMADLPDADGLCIHIAYAGLGIRRGASGTTFQTHGTATADLAGRGAVWVDAEEAIGWLREELFKAWTKWDPGRGVPFRAYATAKLRHGLVNWIRHELGRNGQKPLSAAVSFDDLPAIAGRDPVESALGERALDVPERGVCESTGMPLDLRRVLERRGGELAGEGRRLGVDQAPRSPARA